MNIFFLSNSGPDRINWVSVLAITVYEDITYQFLTEICMFFFIT